MELDEIKALIAKRHYEVSQKIQELLEQEYFEKQDLESCILTATRIHKRQRDERGAAIDGMKYVILGRDTHGQRFYTTGKIIQDYLGHLYFFITAHQAE